MLQPLMRQGWQIPRVLDIAGLQKLFPGAVAKRDRGLVMIDSRTPTEFARDHVPNAINVPVLSDMQHCRVGRLYASSASEGALTGAAEILQNISNQLIMQDSSLRREILKATDKPQEAIVYCARGGKRSQSLAQILAQLNHFSSVSILERGYKTWREFAQQRLATWPLVQLKDVPFIVLSGLTGSGKTFILREALQRQCNFTVLDLEQLANHKGSMLGASDDDHPPVNQKQFDSRLHEALTTIEMGPIWTECESRCIGPSCQMPSSLWTRIRGLSCWPLPLRVLLHVPLEARVQRILQDYRHFVRSSAEEQDFSLLDKFRKFHSDLIVDRWKELAQRGQFESLVAELLTRHYDPVYQQSRQKIIAQSRLHGRLVEIHMPSVDSNSLVVHLMPRLVDFNSNPVE